MNFAAYREILAVAPVRRLLVIAMFARVPHAAAGVLLTLHVVETMKLSYAAAGAIAAAITIGMAIGAPWRGRLVDFHGLRRSLAPSVVDFHGLRRSLAPSVVAEVTVWGLPRF